MEEFAVTSRICRFLWQDTARFTVSSSRGRYQCTERNDENRIGPLFDRTRRLIGRGVGRPHHLIPSDTAEIDDMRPCFEDDDGTFSYQTHLISKNMLLNNEIERQCRQLPALGQIIDPALQHIEIDRFG